MRTVALIFISIALSACAHKLLSPDDYAGSVSQRDAYQCDSNARRAIGQMNWSGQSYGISPTSTIGSKRYNTEYERCMAAYGYAKRD